VTKNNGQGGYKNNQIINKEKYNFKSIVYSFTMVEKIAQMRLEKNVKE